MNRMQQMGIDHNTVEGLKRIIEIYCSDIPDGIYQLEDECTKTSCGLCKAERLLAEVPMKKVKRWETYDGDFVKADYDFYHGVCNNHDCEECYLYSLTDAKRGIVACFAYWLMEEVEVEL